MSKTIFKGEMQLLRWSETSAGGATVTFQLANPADLEGFKDITAAKKGMAGQILAAMIVTVDAEAEKKQKPGELCIMACNFCLDPRFQKLIGAHDELDAAELIKENCGIKSRKELDGNEKAARIFMEKFRGPYMELKAQSDKG